MRNYPGSTGSVTSCKVAAEGRVCLPRLPDSPAAGSILAVRCGQPFATLQSGGVRPNNLPNITDCGSGFTGYS